MHKIHYTSNNRQRIIFGIILIVLLISGRVMAQPEGACSQYLRRGLPHNREVDNTRTQTYRVTTDYYNRDIFGNFFNKFRVRGTYTRGLEGNQASWTDVHIAESMDPDAEFGDGAPLEFMEGFTYIPDEKMMLKESFPGFNIHSMYARNLVWDMMAFEAFAWTYYDSLQLNKTFYATEMNQKIDLEGEGYFENKNVKLMWTGVSSMNDKLCAVIEFITMDNPLGIKNEQFEMKGRSHYWGTIWVSLKSKHIERGVLHEDVVMEMKMSMQPTPQMINATREIAIEKLNTEL